MLTKSKFLTIIFLILALINIFLIYTIFSDDGDITIKNTSKRFSLKYEKSKVLEEAFHNWGIWKTNGMRFNLESKPYTIKHVVIETTDKLENFYTYRRTFGVFNDDVMANFTLSYDYKTQTESIYVYIDPNIPTPKAPGIKLPDPNTVKKKNSEIIRYTVMVGVVTSLYNNRTNPSPSNGYNDLLRKFEDKPEINPFFYYRTNE
ncbi:hypothetical protein BH09PAT1_BH09PAT1_5640 [soil metagenome]